MLGLAVVVPAQLAEVREPRVRPLDRPAKPHRLALRRRRSSHACASSRSPRRRCPRSRGARGSRRSRSRGRARSSRPARASHACAGVVERRREEHRVVAVRAVGCPAEGDAARVGDDRPLPSELRPVGRVLPRSLPASRGFVQGAVERRRRRGEARSPCRRPASASFTSCSKIPAATHSSRRLRTVVSETLLPQSRSASSKLQPVTSRTSITSKQS